MSNHTTFYIVNDQPQSSPIGDGNYPTSPRAILRLKEVMAITSLSRATIYRRMKSGDFPTNRDLASSCRGWRAGEVFSWVENLPSRSQT